MDTVGEHKEFIPQPLKPSSEVAQGSGKQEKPKSFKAAVLAFLTSMGMLGSAASGGPGPQDIGQGVVDTGKNVASAAGDAASFTASRLGERVNALRDNIRTGTPDQDDPRNSQ